MESAMALRAQTLWSEGILLSNATVYIEGREITGITGRDRSGSEYRDVLQHSLAAQEPAGGPHEPGRPWDIIDLGNRTVLPGLIDGHTHTVFPGNGLGIHESLVPDIEALLLRAHQNARNALLGGITSVVDVGGPTRIVFPLAQATAARDIEAARVFPAGPPITLTGGHCWPLGGQADTTDEVVKAARSFARDGSALLKIMGTGGGTPGTNPLKRSYPSETLRALAEEADRLGKMTAIHSGTIEVSRDAAQAGIDIIFHGHFHRPDGTLKYDPDLTSLLIEMDRAVNPTLWVSESRSRAMLAEASLTGDRDLEQLGQYRRDRCRAQQENVGRLLDAGVSPFAGSDAGWGYVDFRDGLIRELIMMQAVGLPPEHGLMAATANIADRLRTPSIGRLKAGSAADVIAAPHNPLDNLEHLLDIDFIICGGRIITGIEPLHSKV